MLTEYLSPVNWRFSSQWVALKRSHVELLVKEKHVRKRFREHCVMQSERHCVPDEHYIPTALSVYGLAQEVIQKLTYPERQSCRRIASEN